MHDYDPELYALLHQGTPGDRDFYQRVVAGAARVLELGCGYGRILDALAEVGVRAVGLDLDDGLLALARARGHDVRHGDMRDFDLGETFDRVLLPHSGLYCLEREEDVVRCLRAVARHLAPEGLLVLDAWPADLFHAEASPEDQADDQLDPVGEVTHRGVTYEVFERSTWDPTTQRVVATYEHVPRGGGATVVGEIPQRYVLASQIPDLLAAAGLELVVLHGDFDQCVYDEDAEHLIVTARLAGS